MTDPVKHPIPPSHVIQIVSAKPPYRVRVESSLTARAPLVSSSRTAAAKPVTIQRDGHRLTEVPLSPFYAGVPGTLQSAASTSGFAASSGMQVLAQGRYANWSWEIRAPSDLAPSWQAWKADAHRVQAVAKPTQIMPALTLPAAMRRLRNLYRYVTGTAPPPLHLTVILIPDGKSYSATGEFSSATALPLHFAVSYPLGISRAKPVMQWRWAAFFDIQALVEMALYDSLDRPLARLSAQQRKQRNTLNRACWVNAAAYSSIAGSGNADILASGPARVSDAKGLSHNFILWYRMRGYYPDNWAIRKVYAEKALDTLFYSLPANDAARPAFPDDGSDIRAINDLVGLCRTIFASGDKPVNLQAATFGNDKFLPDGMTKTRSPEAGGDGR